MLKKIFQFVSERITNLLVRFLRKRFIFAGMESSTNMLRPPVLDGKNYVYWKVRVKAYIKSIDERVWRSILTGWTPPVTTNVETRVETVKPEQNWSTEEDRLANYNFKALNVIFATIDVNQFKLISVYESAREAWIILENEHEGTSAVKISKLQMLASKFKDLRMLEDESINDFNSKLCEIANKAFTLCEKYPKIKLVKKTLRSLPDRFVIKVDAIEEAKDVNIMRLDELMRSLLTFELNLK